MGSYGTRYGTLRTRWVLPNDDEVILDVDYAFLPGAKPIRPTLDHAGEDAGEGEVEIGDVRIVDEAGNSIASASKSLSDDIAASDRIYAECVLQAEEFV